MDQKKRDQLGKDIDISQYVACGLAIYDLKSHTLKKLIRLILLFIIYYLFQYS